MPKYVRRPTEVDAIKFAGGSASATTIAKALLPHGFTTTWVAAHSAFSLDEAGAVVERTIPEVLTMETTEGERVQALAGQWVALGADSNVQIFEDAVFAKLYQTA